MKSQTLVTCKTCKKEFYKLNNQIVKTKNHFCCRSHAAMYNNKGIIRNPKKEKTCVKCKNSFIPRTSHSSKRLCFECLNETNNIKEYYKSLTLADYWNLDSIKDKHVSWKNVHLRSFNRTWNKHLTKLPCAICGYDKHVELAHIIAVSKFPPTAKLGEINSSKNVIQLCPNCHWEFDNGLIKDPLIGFEPT